MKWSKYNLVFESKKYGCLLYNSLSNTFCRIGPELKEELALIQKDPDTYDFNRQLPLLMQLRESLVLVEEGEEEEQINFRKLKLNHIDYGGEFLLLIIALTWACNFACTYCYETDANHTPMSGETEEKLLAFIKRFRGVRAVFINWFGGEPTLEFDRIRSITGKLDRMGVRLTARLTTNGYLLDKDKIEALDDLHIRQLKITIDGEREDHDRRRFLKSGRGTYDRIVENLETLLNSKWSGELTLRVNLDKRNQDQFVKVYEKYAGRRPSQKLIFEPVVIWEENMKYHPELSCSFQRDEQAAFFLDLAKKHNIMLPAYIYPGSGPPGCLATNRNGFVISPAGGLYKCPFDASRETRRIGDLANDALDLSIISKYMIDANMFNDPECRNCFFLPVCEGGCPLRRLENKYEGARYDNCIVCKNRLPEFLESYWEHLK